MLGGLALSLALVWVNLELNSALPSYYITARISQPNSNSWPSPLYQGASSGTPQGLWLLLLVLTTNCCYGSKSISEQRAPTTGHIRPKTDSFYRYQLLA